MKMINSADVIFIDGLEKRIRLMTIPNKNDTIDLDGIGTFVVDKIERKYETANSIYQYFLDSITVYLRKANEC